MIFSDYYYPGYRAGGALRSLYNTVKILELEKNIFILTRGYDCSTQNIYSDVELNSLIAQDNIKIIYSYKKFIPDFIILLFNAYKNNVFKSKYDVVYLNSFFSPYASIFPQILIFFGFIKCRKIIIAPRGELNKEGLEIKGYKKRFYISFQKLFNKFLTGRNYVYHSSGCQESSSIKRIFLNSSIFECIDPPTIIKSDLSLYKPSKNILNLVFFSRIDRKKNLKYLIELLIKSKFKFKVHLDIIGYISDKEYWINCQKEIKKLPQNIYCRYLGNYSPEQIYKSIPKYDIFVFPTFGENFGHVIFESIRLGTPVLTTPYTPWSKNENGILNTLELENHNLWLDELDEFSKIDIDKRIKLSELISESIMKSSMFNDFKKQQTKLFN